MGQNAYDMSEVRYSHILIFRSIETFDTIYHMQNYLPGTYTTVVVCRCLLPHPSVVDRFDASRLATGPWPALQFKGAYVNTCRPVLPQRVGGMTRRMYLWESWKTGFRRWLKLLSSASLKASARIAAVPGAAWRVTTYS